MIWGYSHQVVGTRDPSSVKIAGGFPVLGTLFLGKNQPPFIDPWPVVLITSKDWFWHSTMVSSKTKELVKESTLNWWVFAGSFTNPASFLNSFKKPPRTRGSSILEIFKKLEVEVITKVLSKSKNHPTLVFSVIGFCKMSAEEWFKGMKFLRCLLYTVLRALEFFPFCKHKFGLNVDLILPYFLKPKSRMLTTKINMSNVPCQPSSAMAAQTQTPFLAHWVTPYI